jgi:MFS family permease
MKPVAAAWRDYRDAARSFSPAARRFLLSTLFAYSAFGIHQVLFNLYLVEGGFRESFVGRTLSMMGLGLAVAALPAGVLADRWGRRRCLIAGGIIDAAALGLRALTIEPSLLLATSFVAGFGQSMIAIAAAPFLTEHSGTRERTHLFSAYFALQLLAGVAGSLIGGWLPHALDALALGGLDRFHAYRATLVTGAVIEMASTLPLLLLRGHSETPVVHERAERAQHVSRLYGIGAFALLLGSGAGLVIPFMNLYFASRFQCSSAQIGVFFSLAQVSTALAALIGPALSRRFGRLRTAVGSQMLSIPFLVTLGFETHLGLAVGAFWIRATLMQAAMPLLMSFIMEALPPSLRARSTSLINLCWNVGWAASATLSGVVIQSFGYATPFSVCAVLYLAATVTFWLSFRNVTEGIAEPVPAAEALAAEPARVDTPLE